MCFSLIRPISTSGFAFAGTPNKYCFRNPPKVQERVRHGIANERRSIEGMR